MMQALRQFISDHRVVPVMNEQYDQRALQTLGAGINFRTVIVNVKATP